ncbi:MAG: hypothetical protein MZV65_30395 [Chromatiales bacterium]|nr:hypothetical protein [Chromatiales bacterium]
MLKTDRPRPAARCRDRPATRAISRCRRSSSCAARFWISCAISSIRRACRERGLFQRAYLDKLLANPGGALDPRCWAASCGTRRCWNCGCN